MSEVVLGYHSPTEWVFYPDVYALYSRIIINKDVFDKVIEEGKNSPSVYRKTKAEVFSLLEEKEILVPTEYSVSTSISETLESVVNHFLVNFKNDMYALGEMAFRSFIAHEKNTLEHIVQPDDPHYSGVVSMLPRLESVHKMVSDHTPIDEIPNFREILKRYFEEVLISPLFSPEGYNPIFQWEGYSHFEEWVLKRRGDQEMAWERTKKGTSRKVLSAFTEVLIPGRILRSTNEVGKLINHWDTFHEVRKHIETTNKAIWGEIEAAHLIEPDKEGEFVADFERFLELRVNSVSNLVAETDAAIEEYERSSLTHRIGKFFIQTLGSIVPGTGGLASLLEDLHKHFVESQVRSCSPIRG
ncbi:MAG: hypothetical protein ACTSWQ_05790, partial [Candidatus Thorarchaeota archaeon]